mmetsp:Transcript_16588/g.24559  ORF Transcript_16588/g.24559 Transcript_16588/m.24559 type:complete len:250 (+) Transcript_16588:190-939(+)|eukprot:CAMPEP_0171451708 /NCGR_PEP_ID=MMETSP0945-20130129/102_1 /TAXON_ID=109269 /ORGANISM="Vaucheria litorea, Strain CCMP2940" /LENGTH=249 /DNA_ID=CAMNT_0011976217 /DNA_START=176 /DNA_END=925 /DNA_ORIENTATION=-
MDTEKGPDYGSVPNLDENLKEYGHEHFSHRTPWLRAAVLGANDGLVSVSSILMGVAGGGATQQQALLAGLSGLVGGACSMALGEYVSVWSQKDSELADIEKEKQAQELGPESRAIELDELTLIYIKRGLPEKLAREVAVYLTETDVIRAHARDELGIDMDELSNPVQATLTSAFSFSIGAAPPVIVSALAPTDRELTIGVLIVCLVGLVILGITGSYLGGSSIVKGGARVFIGGSAALVVTYIAGSMLE